MSAQFSLKVRTVLGISQKWLPYFLPIHLKLAEAHMMSECFFFLYLNVTYLLMNIQCFSETLQI